MLKWIFYTNELLRRGGIHAEQLKTGHLTQGLLQHYGWRSFFVDLTASPAVAAWFASHSFSSKRSWQFCENSFEEPVMLGEQTAHYTDHGGAGHLYVLNKEQLKESGHELVSLVDDLTTDCVTRFQVQQAWLAGLFLKQERIDPLAITAEITASASVFKELSEAAGFKATDSVFPSPDDDKILGNMLRLPRIKIDMPNPPVPFYLRSLEIPEYQDSYVHHLPLSTVLYSKMWLSEATAEAKKEFWLHVPEETFYGDIGTDGALPKLCELFRAHEVTNIETSGLICLPAWENRATFEKGISIRRRQNMVEVCGIAVDYQSDRLIGAGADKGYHYEMVDDRLVRRQSPNDCPCGDPARHKLHLRGLAVLEDMLIDAKIQRSGNVIDVSIRP
jgi:hypothetical protein